MGHIQLGGLPRTRTWKQVVNLIDDKDSGAPAIARATLKASEKGLEQASNDSALVQSFWLLTQLPLCARAENYAEELGRIGISVSGAPTLMELVGAFSIGTLEKCVRPFRHTRRTSLPTLDSDVTEWSHHKVSA